MEKPAPGAPPAHHRKSRRSQHSGKSNPYSGVEGIISKQLLKVAGLILILAVIGYSVSSLDKLRGLVKQLSSHERVMQQTAPSTAGVQTGVTKAAPFVQASVDPSDVKMMILLCALTTMFFAALLLFSARIRRKEIPRISGAVFYALAFLLARKYGWQINVLFPMILVYSAVNFYSGIRLHSTMAAKWNMVVCWGFFMIWWALKVILGGDSALLPGFFVYGSLLYLFFLYMGAYGRYKGHHKFSEYVEIALILFNTTLFYMMGMVSLVKFGHVGHVWIFSLLMAFVNLGILVVSEKAGKRVEPGPYVFPAVIMLSLIFPFIFQMSGPILFMAIVSVLLLFYSKYSGDRIAVLTAFASIVLMLLLFFKDWVLQYLPAAFFGNVLDNPGLMMKGLVAGLVIFPVMIINGGLVRKLHVGFSKEWFSRRTYQRFFKGINLVVLYLCGFWIVNYFVLVWSNNPDLNYMSWFGYNCLFFIAVIPTLFAQKSKFIEPAIGFALFFSLAYPTLLHFSTMNLRNEALLHEHLSRLVFWFHYPVAFVFVAELIILLIFIRKTFQKNQLILRIFTFYLLIMGLFILLSEYDHYSIWTELKRGITIEEIALANRVLPYTMILLAYSGVILGVGLVSRNKLLRAAGLIFLLGTTVKMLYLDMRVLSGTSRSVVFFIVGVIVLSLSFMYPKMKRYFRHHDHEAKGISKRHRHHSSRRKDSIPGEEESSAGGEAV